MPTRALIPFFAIAFGLSWGIFALFVGLQGQAEALFGKMGYTNPLFIVALSLILTPMFNAARGSLLVAALFHFQVNGPAWPDAQPWDSVILAGMAALIVASKRRHFFDKTAAAVEVLMPARSLDDRPAKSA